MKTNSIGSSTLIFTILTFLQPAISFFLLPLYLKYFTAEDYAIYVLMTTVIFFTGIFAAGRISSAIFPYYYDLSYSSDRLNKYLGNIIGFTILSNILLFIVFGFIGNFLFDIIFINHSVQFFPLGLIAISIALTESIYQPYTIFLKNRRQVVRYSYIHLISIALSVIFQITLIIIFNLGILGALIAKLIASTFTAIIIIILNAEIITFKFNKYYILKSLKYSLPLIPFLLLVWIQRFGDRYIFEHYLTLETLATYSLLITICLLIAMLTEAIMKGIQPFLFGYYHKNKEGDRYKIKVIYQVYISIVIVFASIVVLVGTHIEFITDKPEYLKVIEYLFIGSTIFIIAAYSEIFRQILIFNKKSKILSTYSFFSVGIMTGMFMFSIPLFEIWGAITSSIVINLVTLIVLFYYCNRLFKMAMNWTNLFLFGFIVLLIELFAFTLSSWHILSYSAAAIIQLLLVVVITVLFNHVALKILYIKTRNYFNRQFSNN